MNNIDSLENALTKLKGTYYLLSLICDSTLTSGLTLDKEQTQIALFAIEESLKNDIDELADIVFAESGKAEKIIDSAKTE